MNARLPLVGMINEMTILEIDLNKNWTLDNTRFDKEVLLATIVQKGATFEPIYTDPNFLYMMSNMWWKKWKRTFQNWFDEFDIKYTRVENWDKYENWSEGITDEGFSNTETSNTEVIDDDTSKSATTKEVVDDDQTSSDSSSISNTTGSSGNSTTTNSVSAFDSGNNLVTHDSSTTNTSDNSTSSTTSTASGTSTDDKTTDTTYNESGTDDRTTTNNGTSDTTNGNERTIEHEYHGHGNIGVMYGADMIKKDLDKDYWNEYNHIADIFLREFCVRVY